MKFASFIDDLAIQIRGFQKRALGRAFAFYLLFSLAALALLHFVEMSVGIDKRTHIDSATYAELSEQQCADIQSRGLLSLPGNAMYCVVDLVGEHGAILLNALMVAGSTALLLQAIFSRQLPLLGLITVLLIAFAPYRYHLGIHLLKDSYIQFFATLALFWRGGALWSLPMILFSPRGLVYIVFSFRAKYLLATAFLALLSLYLFFPGYWSTLMSVLTKGNTLQFVFQEYDQVPTFREFNMLGDWIRALVWPLFLLSGFFIFISPAPLFFPIALIGFTTLLGLWTLRRKVNWELIGLIYLGLAVFALIAPGFTGYTRYAYPFVTVVLIAALIGLKPLQLSEIFGRTSVR
ncbi:MAG: hypothetical protein HWE12_13235 [Oceanospirillaceae bacterium]|nr:hypothetical protein [Oceanospirillaceae bacterium]